MKYLGKTPPFRGPKDKILPRSIAEINYLSLGGLDQWVMIRGENLNNPPLILLHGGPGFSDTPFFRHYNAPLEKSFTVVCWDQRGTGKSFDRHIPRSSMTVEQFIADLDELVEAVCKRVRKNKVAIFGHSWALLSACSMVRVSPRRLQLMSEADKSATGRQQSRHRMPLRWPKRSVSATARP